MGYRHISYLKAAITQQLLLHAGLNVDALQALFVALCIEHIVLRAEF